MLPPHHRAAAASFHSPLRPPPPNPLLLAAATAAAAATLSFIYIIKPQISAPPLLSFLHHPLRRLRLRLHPSPMDPTPISFSSPENLAEWLTPLLPPGSLASWGSSPGTKNLHNLYLELAQGETSLLLSPSPPSALRAVHVATVRILNPTGSHLVESHQLLSDGTIRYRNRPLSEKMRPGESIEAAALRAIREELGVLAARVVPGTYQTRVEERSSASYPGLPARYFLHSVDAQVDGLPEAGEFSTDEAGEYGEAQEEKAVFVKQHYWKWVDDDSA